MLLAVRGGLHGLYASTGAPKNTISAGGRALRMATNSRWHTTVSGLLPGIAWGLLVLVLTLVLLVLGAIVLPAQAHKISTLHADRRGEEMTQGSDSMTSDF